MQRDVRAYLNDIIEACEAIEAALTGLDLAGYRSNRLVRSSVEREFIIVGEAMAALGRLAPQVFAGITQSRRIVDFRNQLTHGYSIVDDAVVWLIAGHDVAVLREECVQLLGAYQAES
ncbi:MAG: DUF86 domain-containing protein [Actinobacteria bacterium]|nr:DUF86 domain-containing protein [Actinomycetota bacterium]